METNVATLWKEACTLLESTLSKDVFDRWIGVIDVVQLSNNELTLSVANDFYQSWLEENYVPLIKDAIGTVCGEDISITFKVDPSKKTEIPSRIKPAQKKEKKKSSRVKHTPSFNARYTFDNFIVGPSNNFAHAAAMAVAQSPAKAYNPLFIYGGVGLGKTHLMQAVGQHVFNVHKQAVSFTSCETFLNDYIDALQNKGLVQFRKKYREIDLLLIDDIHFLAGKERLQEEFFHTFNALYESHKQIVLTCDRPASEIPGLAKRLISRFEWGLVTELEMPDTETRLAILRKKQEQIGLYLSDDITLFMAEHVKSNIRRLEGALIRVASYASLTGKPVTMDTIYFILRDTLDQEKQEALTIETVQRAVAEYYDIRLGDMTSKQRPKSIAFPRQVAMYLCREMTECSLPTIGNAFGRNHATVLHAHRSIGEKTKTDHAIRQTLSAIKQKLGRK